MPVSPAKTTKRAAAPSWRSGRRGSRAPRARSFSIESRSRSRFLIEHDLFGKPVSTFPDHALASGTRGPGLSLCPGNDEPPSKLTRLEAARRIIEEYAADLREINNKLRRRLN